MPGRTTAEAHEAFIRPFRNALACLGSVKITTSPGGASNSRGAHAWSLNAGKGMLLPGGFRLRAAMQYEFLRDQSVEGGPWRCTTRGYMYAEEGRNPDTRREQELIAYHWHPLGASHYKAPHLHLGTPALAPTGVFTAGSHLPSGRVSFEGIVRMLIMDLHIEPQRNTWAEDLRLSENLFELYRSWGTVPPREGGGGAGS